MLHTHPHRVSWHGRRRVPAEYYLADGVLQVGGDVGLGETVLQHLRAFAA